MFGLGESFGAATLLQALKQENRFCAVVAESTFSSFRQISYIRVGQFLHTGVWLGEIVLRPAVEFAFLYGQITRGVNIASASPESAVVGSSLPIFLIHGLADTNIPPRQSERIQAHNPAKIVLWEVPNAGHCGAADAAGEEFKVRVLDWFASHNSTGSVKFVALSSGICPCFANFPSGVPSIEQLRFCSTLKNWDGRKQRNSAPAPASLIGARLGTYAPGAEHLYIGLFSYSLGLTTGAGTGLYRSSVMLVPGALTGPPATPSVPRMPVNHARTSPGQSAATRTAPSLSVKHRFLPAKGRMYCVASGAPALAFQNR